MNVKGTRNGLLRPRKAKKMRKVCENLWTNPCGFISFKKYMKNIRQSQRLIQWLSGKMRFFSRLSLLYPWKDFEIECETVLWILNI